MVIRDWFSFAFIKRYYHRVKIKIFKRTGKRKRRMKRWLGRRYRFFNFKRPKFHVKNSGFFLLTASVWPLFSSLAAFTMLFNFASYFHYYEVSSESFFWGVFYVASAFFFWCRDLIRELTFLKKTSKLVESNIRTGFWLFIVSEIMLFVSFFWAFFHASLEVGIELGGAWPPFEGIHMDSLLIPSWNTIILLASGAALTWGQYSLLSDDGEEFLEAFFFLFGYAFMFLYFQYTEYFYASHQLNDSVFGSTMYVLTFFHGAHVLIGTIFLIVCFIRYTFRGHMNSGSYLSLTLAGWYWHFVDAVWVLVYLFIYTWGTNTWEGQYFDYILHFNYKPWTRLPS